MNCQKAKNADQCWYPACNCDAKEQQNEVYLLVMELGSVGFLVLALASVVYFLV